MSTLEWVVIAVLPVATGLAFVAGLLCSHLCHWRLQRAWEAEKQGNAQPITR